MNLSLRYAINDAKAVSMPKDNIERAIKKGTGDLDGVAYDEVIYEGYGPGGVAILCDILTDNRNRTAPEVRNLFERNGGNLGATGCVAWMFDRKGLLVVDIETIDEEKLLDFAIENGADDVKTESDAYDVTCAVENFAALAEAFEKADIKTETCKISRIPQNMVDVEAHAAKKVLKLLELLDDHDDIQNVFTNFNITEEVMALLED